MKNHYKQWLIKALFIGILSIGIISLGIWQHQQKAIQQALNTTVNSLTKATNDHQNIALQSPVQEFPEERVQILPKNKKLPYRSKMLILDKALFIGYDADFINIGGVSIEDLQLRACSEEGEHIPFQKDDYKQLIKFSYWENPWIEVKYKEIFYQIDIQTKNNIPFCTVSKIDAPIMNLEAI